MRKWCSVLPGAVGRYAPQVTCAREDRDSWIELGVLAVQFVAVLEVDKGFGEEASSSTCFGSATLMLKPSRGPSFHDGHGNSALRLALPTSSSFCGGRCTHWPFRDGRLVRSGCFASPRRQARRSEGLTCNPAMGAPEPAESRPRWSPGHTKAHDATPAGPLSSNAARRSNCIVKVYVL